MARTSGSSACGERIDRWEAGHEACVVIEDGVNTRLLEHDFRNPDRVRVVGAAPGKVTGVRVKPVEEQTTELAKLGWTPHSSIVGVNTSPANR